MYLLNRTWMLGLTSVSLIGCGGSGEPPTMLPQLAAAQQATLRECANLSAIYAPAGTTLASAVMKAPGEVSVMLNGNATPMPEHCVVNGRMNSRVSPVDGRNYAISFEMRLPKDWNGRFFYQANGGLEGTVVPAYGEMLGGSPSSNALLQGFAVVSSDAGHAFDRSLPPAIGAAIFGIDPQARADFGYNTIAQVTPMAKGLISAAYGKVPDRSYIAGCSNGGRSALVAAARYTNEYDGILAGAPGLDLPKIAVMQIWDAQTAATVAPLRANGRPDFAASFSDAELAVVSRKVLEKCDALDGIADGMVGDMAQCQSKADLAQDVPTCSAASDVQCLPAAKKAALVRMLAGPRNAAGAALYASFPLDAGISAPGWRTWKIGIAPSLPQGLQRGGGAAAFLFTAPPANPTVVRDLDSLTDWVLNFSFDTDAPKIAATTETYRESAMETVNPPNATDLRALRTRGAKLMAYNGVSDPGMSANNLVNWYHQLGATQGSDPGDFARMYLIPGMNHCGDGPAADKFDMLTPLVDWVEKGVVPEAVIATARPASQNPGVGTIPTGRTRPLCPWPKVARYEGGNSELASSFACK